MGSRRNFIRNSLLGTAALGWPSLELFGSPQKPGMKANDLKISLAQWSLHRAFEKGDLKAADFPVIARERFGIDAVEYVGGFYRKQLGNDAFWQALRQRAASGGVQNLLVMVDEEGQLGALDSRERDLAVDRHRPWLDIAKLLGCHSVRVNAFGKGSREELKGSLTDGLGRLAEAGESVGIHVLIENHGLHTSDAAFMVEVIRAVNSPYLGTLPDFGNWCLNKEWGSTMGGSCTESYDPVRGLEEFLPFARGVSAKSYDFDASGQETLLPYRALLQRVKDSGFAGHIGIEYEGSRLSEPEGILATKALLETTWSQLE